MKKILALLLALTMILASGLAFADVIVLTPGTPTGCGAELFKAYFTVMTQNAGYNFTWTTTPLSEDGTDVYTALSEDGAMTVKAFCVDGNVSYVLGYGSLSVDTTDQASAEKFGEWLGAALSGACLSIYAGDEGPDAVAGITDQFQNEVTPLLYSVTSKLTSDEKMKNGVADITTVLGYPCGMLISGAAEGTTVNMTMQVYVGSKDTQLVIDESPQQ